MNPTPRPKAAAEGTISGIFCTRRSHNAASNGMNAKNTPTLVQSISPANTPETKEIRREAEPWGRSSHQALVKPSTIPSSSGRATWRNRSVSSADRSANAVPSHVGPSNTPATASATSVEHQGVVAHAGNPAETGCARPLAEEPGIEWRINKIDPLDWRIKMQETFEFRGRERSSLAHVPARDLKKISCAESGKRG